MIARVANMYIALMALGGCASLEVEVAVLNPDATNRVAAETVFRRTSPSIEAESPEDIEDRIGLIQAQHFDLYVILSNAYIEEARRHRNLARSAELSEFATQLLSDFAPAFERRYRGIERQFIENQILLKKQIFNSEGQSAFNAAWVEYQRLFDVRTHLVTKLSNMIENDGFDLDGRLNGLASSALGDGALSESASKELAAEVVFARNSPRQLFESGGIIDSPYAYTVVSSKGDEFWAEQFDRSVGRGVFGNTDIAIKALGPGNFTIKGLSFNPSDVATAASTVTTQAVLLAAQISGVPVNISGTPSGVGASLASSSTTIANRQTAVQSEQTSMSGFKDALEQVALAILAERDVIVADENSTRVAAIAAIQAAYDSHKSRLSLNDQEQ